MAELYTPYRLAGGQVVQVPNKAIANYQKQLGISKTKAVELWLYDEGYTESAEADSLTAKAQENKVKHSAAKGKPKTPRERTQKEQPIKEEIISTIAETLASIGATEIKVENKAKLVTFIAKDGEPYAIDLKWERNKSKAMKEGKG